MGRFHTLASKLRQAGCHVRVTHMRHYRKEDGTTLVTSLYPRNRKQAAQEGFNSQHLLPHGGVTLIQVTLPDGTEVTDVANCSHNDSYNKARGREIAMGRLAKHGRVAGLL